MFLHLMYLLAAGQVAAGPSATKPTPQQQFDAATAAAEAGHCNEAIVQFEAADVRSAAKRNALAAATIDVRKGICLARLGREAEGQPLIRRGLPILIAKGAEFASDQRDAHRVLGSIAMGQYDYATAAAEFKLALNLSHGQERYSPLTALAQVLTFDAGDEAVGYATEARTMALADPKLTQDQLAVIQTQYARVLLNRHREQEAYAELKDSLRRQGGLGTQVSLSDVITRSDLAIAALLNKDKQAAQKYLAYTGAGRLKDGPFDKAVNMQPPICGPATGLKPEDYAIVQFRLEEDGSVSGAQPVFASGDRSVALEFAKAVSGWSWQSEDVKTVPPLLRFAMRVELRCSSADERPLPTLPLKQAFADWLEQQGRTSAPWDPDGGARALPVARAALARARQAGDHSATVQALVFLGTNPLLLDDERRALLGEALAEARALRAPVVVTTLIAISQAEVGGQFRKEFNTALRAWIADPAVAQDPVAAATVRVLLAQPRAVGRSRPLTVADTDALLDAVIDEPKLDAHHPLKVTALLQRANRLSANGHLPEAQAAFERTGLSEDQCALIGLTPTMRSIGNVGYPLDVQMMGFEGWVQLEFDVTADGRPLQPRVLIAYPPFVFDSAAIQMGNAFRFQSSYRPTGKLSCSANHTSIKFNIHPPTRH